MRWHALVIGALAALLYWVTGPQTSGGDIFIALADAFWHGHLTVAARSWIELVPLADGTWAVPFPPAPALFYLPVVAVMGTREWSEELSVSVMPALVGGVAVGLSVLMLSERLQTSRASTLWIAAGFATTTLWWVAGMGGTHHMAQVSAVAFSLGALYLALGQRLPVVAGLLFALAVASRLPVGLSLPLFLYLYRQDGGWWRFLLGALPVALAEAAYNFARFGSPLENGYALIPSGTDHLVTDEPWYRHGLESPLYIPNGLRTMFLSGFSIKPSYQGASILLTAPFLLWSVTARGRLGLVAGISAVLVLLVDLMHGNPGVAQFGYRFVLDAAPVLLVCLGLGLKGRPPLVFQAAVVFGAAVTLWGIVAINVLGFVS